MSQALLVPITLDVLVVRPEDATPWADVALKVPAPGPKDAWQDLVPPPFQTLASGRSQGAHLHWALPDALTEGAADDPGAGPSFPPVPDRWLVLRLAGPMLDAGDRRRVDAWLIPDASSKEPVRLDALSGLPLPPPNPSAGPLTALGHGDAGWAAYYDNVGNRLAFHDPLDGVEGAVAYVVCGWYTDLKHDPIRADSESALKNRLSKLRWALASGDAGVVRRPNRCVFHGAAVSIGWPRPTWPGDGGSLAAEVDRRPGAADIDVALGENLAEALAALGGHRGDPALERLLEGAVSGLLGDLRSPDAVPELDATLHASSFGSTPVKGGTDQIWDAASSPDATPSFLSVYRTAPRAWHALPPAIVLRGGGRSPKHGADGRYTTTGALICRVEGESLTALGVEGGDPGRGDDALPDAPLKRLRPEYGVPAAVEELLVELACLDPASAPDLADGTESEPSPVAAMRSRFWASFDPAVPISTALAGAHLEPGTFLPSPVGVTTPSRPWTPLHLEWSAFYRPSRGGARDWTLGEVDYAPPATFVEAPGAPSRRLTGRALLDASPSKLLEGAWSAAGSAPEEVAGQDLLAGTFVGMTELLRGEPTGVWVPAEGGSETPGTTPRPDDFVAVRAGALELERLRLVDTFGQFVDLPVRSSVGATGPRLGRSLRFAESQDLAALKPRFTAPARVKLRFAVPDGQQLEATPSVSPVCGYLLPCLTDRSIEVLDADAKSCGVLLPDARTLSKWEEGPGTPATVGGRPSAVIPNRYLGAVADAVIAADTALALARARGATGPRDGAREALLKVVDATRWTVDPFGTAGTEHLGMMIGQPIAVVRAVVELDPLDPRRLSGQDWPDVAVKLGTLGRLDDGVLGYFVGDRFDRLFAVDPAVVRLAPALTRDGGVEIEGVESPYVEPSGWFHLSPRTRVPLTLLVVPGSKVHVTTGLVPQKGISMLREWTAKALSIMQPTFRYGPVLREQGATRIPVPATARGRWQWHHRPDPATWATEFVVTATETPSLPDDRVELDEGWLHLDAIPDPRYAAKQQEGYSIEITCVRAVKRGKSRELLAVGGFDFNGDHFLIPIEQAADLVDRNIVDFYVVNPKDNSHTKVEARRQKGSTKMFLRSRTDSDGRDNLLSLPDCEH